MPEWIDKRQQHIRAKNPGMEESTAWAIATQQAHAAGKSPKGYGTAEGRHEAKAKYDEPKREYEKTPDPGGAGAEKFEKTSEEVQPITEEGRKRFRRRAVTGILSGMAAGGAGGAALAHKLVPPGYRMLVIPAAAAVGAPLGGLTGAVAGAQYHKWREGKNKPAQAPESASEKQASVPNVGKLKKLPVRRLKEIEQRIQDTILPGVEGSASSRFRTKPRLEQALFDVQEAREGKQILKPLATGLAEGAMHPAGMFTRAADRMSHDVGLGTRAGTARAVGTGLGLAVPTVGIPVGAYKAGQRHERKKHEQSKEASIPLLRSPMDLGVVTGFSAELQEIEKLSSVMSFVGDKLRNSPEIQQALGDAATQNLRERGAEALQRGKKYGLPAALALGGLYTGHKIHQGAKRRRQLNEVKSDVADLRQQLGIPDPRGQVGMQALDQLYKEGAATPGVPATPSSIRPRSAKKLTTGQGRVIPTSAPQPPTGGGAQGYREIPPSATEAAQRPA